MTGTISLFIISDFIVVLPFDIASISLVYFFLYLFLNFEKKVISVLCVFKNVTSV